ncbi:MAG: ABC transporter substrate-binding protein [Verrucomicrobia bacterium]|nr:ABC transporter substrate-binding protein [Verrucomicrobiota bacterium]MDA1064981.1 ABC transporter substrate-binding protein [Verrucomicrobiota bacterium]
MRSSLLPKALSFFACLMISSGIVSAEEKPEVALKNTVEGVIDVLFQADSTVSIETKREQVLAVLNRSFSFEVIVRRTLGRNWDKLKPEQQKQIVSLATDLMIRSYTREFKEGIRPIVEYKSPLELAKNKIEISSTLVLSDNKINLSYRLARLESGWQVYDIIVEGVSLVSNYRKQFDAHFQKKNGDDLIDQLEAKLAEL